MAKKLYIITSVYLGIWFMVYNKHIGKPNSSIKEKK